MKTLTKLIIGITLLTGMLAVPGVCFAWSISGTVYERDGVSGVYKVSKFVFVILNDGTNDIQTVPVEYLKGTYTFTNVVNGNYIIKIQDKSPLKNYAFSYTEQSVTVTDQDVSGINFYRINRPPNKPKVPATLTLEEGEYYKIDVFWEDGALDPANGDPDGADNDDRPFTVQGYNLPQGAVLDERTGEFEWIPNYNQQDTYEITFTATDKWGGVSEPATMAVTVLDNPGRPLEIVSKVRNWDKADRGPAPIWVDFTIKNIPEAAIPYAINYDEHNTIWWKFGERGSAFWPQPTQIFPEEGVYAVELKITDKDLNLLTQAQTTIIVDPEPQPKRIFYISPTGNDANNGLSPQTAWKTFRYALLKLYAGDTLKVTDGTYVLDSEVAISRNSGTQDNWIIIEAEEGTYPIIDQANMGRFYISTAYVKIKNLEFINYPDIAAITSGNYNVIEGCKLSNYRSAIRNGAYSKGLIVRNCEFWNDRELECFGIDSIRGDGILFENNVFYVAAGENRRWAVLFKGCYTQNIEFRYNKFVALPNAAPSGFALETGGQLTEHDATRWDSAYVSVHDNLFYNWGAAFYIRHTKHQITYNNSVYAPNYSGIVIHIKSPSGWDPFFPEKNTIRNNIFYTAGSADTINNSEVLRVDLKCENGFRSDYNLWYGKDYPIKVNWAGAMKSFSDYVALTRNDFNSFVADPLFVDPENQDLRIHYTSPAKDSGFKLPLGCIDLAGNPRPMGTGSDMGCYEMPADNLPAPAVDTLKAYDKPNDDGGRIVLDWSGYRPPIDFLRYKIYRSTMNFSDVIGMTPLVILSSSNIASHLDTTTVDSQNYYYAVTVENISGLENTSVVSFGPVKSIDNGDQTPTAITNLIVQDTPNDYGMSIDLNWTGYNPPLDFSHYNIYRSQESFNDLTFMQPIGKVTNSYQTYYADNTVSEYIHTTEYHYAITCVDKNENEVRAVISVGPVKSVNNFRPWPDGKLAAVCLTQDDGRLESYEDAKNNLSRYGFKASYFINTARIGGQVSGADITMSWAQVQELYDLGHEIASHSHTHPRLNSLTDEEYRQEFELFFEYMRANTTIPDEDLHWAFAYPYGEGYRPEILSDYVRSARVIGGGINSRRPDIDFYALRGGGPQASLDDFIAIVDKTIAQGKWVIFYEHRGFSNEIIDVLAARSDKIWVAPQGEVVKHLLGDGTEPPQPQLPGDFDGDGDVDLQDLLIVAKGYGVTYDLQDLLLVAMHYGEVL